MSLNLSIPEAVDQFGIVGVLACFHEAGWPASTTAAAITSALDAVDLELALLGSDQPEPPR